MLPPASTLVEPLNEAEGALLPVDGGHLPAEEEQVFPTAMLSNGMEVACLQRHDAPIVHAEVEAYFRHGIQVREGDTIFDVGANIGLFALSVLSRCNQNARVYAFEPLPPILEVLRANARRHDPQVATQDAPDLGAK